MAAVVDRFYATGRRKTSVARVWIRPGAGRIIVNRRAFEDYFPRETLRMIIAQPLEVTSTLGQFDVFATVNGGGPTGQAGAVRHGLARALARSEDPDEIHDQLVDVLPRSDWTLSTHLFQSHGRRCCTARKPLCPACPVRALCPWPSKTKIR